MFAALPPRIEVLEPRTLLSAPTQWVSRGPGGGGAFFAPSFSPFQASELYVASDMSDVFHSTNLGGAWSIEPFKQIQGNRGAQVQFTSDPNILYALDYSNLPGDIEAQRPTHSADGGATWTPVAGWDSSNLAYAVYADPVATGNLVVSDYDNLYFSSNSGGSFALRYTAPADGQGLYIAGAFFDGANIFVCTNRGLLVSNNGGATFGLSGVTGIVSTQSMFSFAGAKQGGTTRFFCVTYPTGDIYPGVDIEGSYTDFAGVYSLDAGQASWTNRTSGITAGDYPTFVSMARNNIAIAYVAGGSSAGKPTVSKTTNGGANWSHVFNTIANANIATGWQGAGGDRDWSFGEVALGFEVSPNDPNEACFTDFGYAHLTSDGGTTWRQAYVNPADQNSAGANTPQHKTYHGVGLEDTSAHWLTWSDANNMMAGYTDIVGVRSSDAGSSWSFPTYNPRQNTIYCVAKNNSTSTLYAASSSVHDIYQSTHLTDSSIDGGTGRILFSTDTGATWNTLHDFGHPVIWLATDPTNANRLYASVVNHGSVSNTVPGGIWVTSDIQDGAASAWTKLPDPPRTEGHPFDIRILSDGSLVASYSARRTNVFTASSGVFLGTYSGGNLTWQDRTDPLPSGMQYWTKDVVIDPTDPTQNTWWAGLRQGYGGQGNGAGGLYKTTDRGLHWTRVLASEGVESVTINAATKEMYIATLEQGLWFCPDVTVANPMFSQNSYPFRQPERIFINPFNSNEIWIASFGYGLAVGNTNAPPRVLNSTFDYLTAPHDVKIQFSADVSASLSSSDITVQNLTTSATYPATVGNGANNTTTLTFATAPNQILPDGNYRLTLAAAGITANGQPLDGNGDGVGGDNYTFDFFFLTGDANHDKHVDTIDFNILAANFGLIGKDYSQGNFNYDATVDTIDFNLLASRFGSMLASSVVAEATTPASLDHLVGTIDHDLLASRFGL